MFSFGCVLEIPSQKIHLLALTDGPESPAGKVMLVTGRNLREITVLGSCCYKMMVVFIVLKNGKQHEFFRK